MIVNRRGFPEEIFCTSFSIDAMLFELVLKMVKPQIIIFDMIIIWQKR